METLRMAEQLRDAMERRVREEVGDLAEEVERRVNECMADPELARLVAEAEERWRRVQDAGRLLAAPVVELRRQHVAHPSGPPDGERDDGDE
jgi:hypothetical protein